MGQRNWITWSPVTLPSICSPSYDIPVDTLSIHDDTIYYRSPMYHFPQGKKKRLFMYSSNKSESQSESILKAQFWGLPCYQLYNLLGCWQDVDGISKQGNEEELR